MILIVTIDTEEDNWADYSTTEITTRNLRRIPGLQALFDRYSIRPTYLVNYPVATDPFAVEMFRDLCRSGKVELGTHCHPWNTPPRWEKTGKEYSMLCNLPRHIQGEKLRSLHNTIAENLGVEPVAFRAGRWGFSNEVAENIRILGYTVDSSVTPFVDWSRQHGPDFSNVLPRPYKFSPADVCAETPAGTLFEIPPTVGFLQRDFELANRIHKAASRIRGGYGLLYRLGLVNKIWLSPEVSDVSTMIRLTGRIIENGYPFLNLCFHSPTLMCGNNDFVKTPEDETTFLRKLEEYLAYAREAGFKSLGLAEAAECLMSIPARG